MRENASEAERPRVGRKPNPKPTALSPAASHTMESDQNINKQKPAKIQNQSTEEVGETLSGKQPRPDYVRKGPIITQQMFDECDWETILSDKPSTVASRYPVRKTRNKNPSY